MGRWTQRCEKLVRKQFLVRESRERESHLTVILVKSKQLALTLLSLTLQQRFSTFPILWPSPPPTTKLLSLLFRNCLTLLLL